MSASSILLLRGAAPPAAAVVLLLLPAALAIPRSARAQTAPAQAYVYVPLNTTGLTGGTPTGINTNGAVGSGSGSATGNAANAFLWNATTGARTTLNMTSLRGAQAYRADGTRAVGGGIPSAGSDYFACVWNTANNTRTALDSAGLTSSFALGVRGNVAVGYGSTASVSIAPMLWDLTTGQRTALDNTGLAFAEARSVSATFAAGGGRLSGDSRDLGFVWDLTSGARTTLDATGLSSSYIRDLTGQWAVGYAQGSATGNQRRAFVWDAATSARRALDSSGLDTSYAEGASGNLAVGYGTLSGSAATSAYVWDLTTGQRTGLAPFLSGVLSPQPWAVGADGTISGSQAGGAFLLRPVSAAAGNTVGAGQTATSSGDFTQTGGTTALNGTFQFASGNTYTLSGGTLGGGGTLSGSLVNTAGTVAPGSSPGTLNVAGSFTQLAGGTLAIELAGTSAGLFDVLNVGGTASLDGALTVSVLNGFTPAAGQSWDILTAAGGITGTFASIPTGYAFSVVNGGTTGRLSFVGATVVPEPGTLALALSALAPVGGLALRRRRRRA